MNTRFLLAAPVLALAATSPAMARDGSTARLAEKMRDPATQRALASAVAAATDAMLDMPLEPLARAAEAAGDRRTARKMQGARLRDIAGPDAERMPREVSRKLPAMMGAAGGMADAVEEMTPALKAMAKEMGARMSEAMRRGEEAGNDDDRSDRRDGAEDRKDAPPPSASEEPDQGGYATPAEGEDTQP